MNRRIKNILGFICFVLVFLVLFSAVSTMLILKDYQWKNFRGFYSEKRDSLDLLYIGGSACYMSWVPYTAWENAGYTSYALGVSSFRSFAYEPLVREVLSYQSPQLLVIDARPFVYTYSDMSSAVTSGITFINSLKTCSTNRIPVAARCYDIYKQAAADGEWTKAEETFGSILFEIERFHNLWHVMDRSYFPPDRDEPQYNYSKGFYGVNESNKQILTDNSGIKSVSETDAKALSDLTALLDYLDKKNVDALFVVAPSTETVQQKEEYNYLASVIEARGYDFVDFNDHAQEMKLDGATDFWNGNHLNIYGAEKYTAYLTGYIEQNYSLTAEHQAGTDRAWTSGCAAWNEIAPAIKDGSFSTFDGGIVNGENDD